MDSERIEGKKEVKKKMRYPVRQKGRILREKGKMEGKRIGQEKCLRKKGRKE